MYLPVHRSSSTIDSTSTMVVSITSTTNIPPQIPKPIHTSSMLTSSTLKIASTDTSHARPPAIDVPATVKEMSDENLQIEGYMLRLAMNSFLYTNLF